MEQTEYITFVFTHSFFADCPSCDGVMEDPEFIKITKASSILNLIAKLEDLLNEKKSSESCFLCLYELRAYGSIHHICDFEMITGGHRLLGVKFVWENKEYKITNKLDGKYRLETAQSKVLYGNK